MVVSSDWSADQSRPWLQYHYYWVNSRSQKLTSATSSALAIFDVIETRLKKSEHGDAESEEFMMNTKV